MEVEVKLLRANVWISSQQLQQQDGFVSVARFAGKERLAHAHTDASIVTSMRQAIKQCKTIPLKWEEKASIEPFQCDDLLDYPSDQQFPKQRIELALFMLKKPEFNEKKQKTVGTFTFLGHGTLLLQRKDIEEAVTSRQVLFLITLHDQLGEVELMLRVTTQKEKQRQAIKDRDAGAFSINWSSMEALQKDIEEKARLKAQADKKLLLRLRRLEDKVMQLYQLRTEVISTMKYHRAARRIQRAYRAYEERLRYERDCEKREHEARKHAKKLAARQKVIERNHVRTQLLLDRLRGLHQLQTSVATQTQVTTQRRSRTTHKHPLSPKPETIVIKQQHTETLQYHKNVALLQIEHIARRQTLDNQRKEQIKHHEQPQDASIPLQSCREQAAPLDDELIRAIRLLHFRK